MFDRLEADWAGRSAILIGGGPSLAGFDFGRLRGQAVVVAINDAIRAAPWADVAFTIDRVWLQCRAREFAAFAGEKVAVVPRTHPEMPGVRQFWRYPGAALSHDPRAIHSGANSGFAALGMTLMRGAARIALLGYDMGAPGHFHAGYEWPSPTGAPDYPAWAAGFAVLAAAAAERGQIVINCNPHSTVRCFRFGAVEEVFE